MKSRETAGDHALLKIAVLVVGWALAFRLGLAVGHVAVVLAVFAVIASAFVAPRYAREWFSLLDLRARDLALGLGVGAASVAVTHAAWPLVAAAVPEWRNEMAQLLSALGATPSWWALPVVGLVAVLEELLFRGPLFNAVAARTAAPWRAVLVATLLYAAAQLGAASALLFLTALALGGLWTALRLWTKRLAASAVAHLSWTLGVLFVVPVQP